MALHDNFKGAFLMSVAMAGFSLNDSMVKIVAPHMNTGQIMFIRGLMTSALIFAVAWQVGALRPLRSLFDRYLAFRTLAEIGASITYVSALGMLPLPNAAAVLQALPLAVTVGAAIFLCEPVGARRWIAILVGFAGVLIILRPGMEGFTAGSMLVVGSVITAAIRDVCTKKISRHTPTLLIGGVASLTVTLVGGALIVPFGGWQPVHLSDIAALGLGSVALFTGYQSLIKGMRTGEISFIAPFRYMSLVWSIVFAALILGEFPDRWMLAGAAVVVAAGLYTFHRENKLHRKLAALNMSATSS